MIKRYEVVGDKYGDGTVKESETGQVVFYEDYAALQQKLDAISAKALELCSEAAQIYQKYNVTQMPDRDLVDHQTIQELSDLIRSSISNNADSGEGK